MATTTLPPESPAVQQQYVVQLALAATLVQALRQLWGMTLPLGSERGEDRFRAGAHTLVEQFSGAASSVALDYYRAVRADADVASALPSRVTRAVAPPPRSLVMAGIDYAMRAAEQDAARVGAELAADVDAEADRALARLDAAMQKALTDTSRRQVEAAVSRDEFAMGFRRVPRPGACAFCILMAIRSTTRQGLAKDFTKYVPGILGGAKHYGIYKSRGTAGADGDFLFDGDGEAKFHNGCNCVIEPVFSPLEVLPSWLADMERLYDDTEGGLNEFRRAIAALRRGEEPQPPPIPALVIPQPNQQAIDALLDLLPKVA